MFRMSLQHSQSGCLAWLQVALEGLSGAGDHPHRRFRLYDPEPYRFISEIIDRVVSLQCLRALLKCKFLFVA